MITVYFPDNFQKERHYIADVILGYFWGIDYQVKFYDKNKVSLEIAGKQIFMNDSFWQKAQNCWLYEESMPEQVLDIWHVKNDKISTLLTENGIPVIYGHKLDNGEYYHSDAEYTEIGIDIFGSAFFMLTRYEEFVGTEKVDPHGRFPAVSSIAYKNGFLERPIINEYLEILWYALKQLAPMLKRKERNFCCLPTHDVDRPFKIAKKSCLQVAKNLAGDLVRRHDIILAWRRIVSFVKVHVFHNPKYDIVYTFDNIMTIDEEYGLKGTYYFMVAQGVSPTDGNYDIFDVKIKVLMQDIARRGHYIGVHPSYESYMSKEQIVADAEKLSLAMQQNLGKSYKFGGRQHYLRWKPETWQYYEDAGIIYDTTLSYADHIGFRCGICYEYPVYNLRTRKQLKLIEYPLIVMECSALDYMGLGINETLRRSLALKEKCRKYNGNFVVLFHNTVFINKGISDLYKKILEG